MKEIILLVSLLASTVSGVENVAKSNSEAIVQINLKNPEPGKYPGRPGGDGYPGQPGGGGGGYPGQPGGGGYPGQPGGGGYPGQPGGGGYPGQPGGGGGGYPGQPGGGGGGYPGQGQGGECQDRRWCENIVPRECPLRQDLWAKCPNVCNTCKCYDLDPNCYRMLNRCNDPNTGYLCRRSCQFCTKYPGGQGGGQGQYPGEQGGSQGQYPKSN